MELLCFPLDVHSAKCICHVLAECSTLLEPNQGDPATLGAQGKSSNYIFCTKSSTRKGAFSISWQCKGKRIKVAAEGSVGSCHTKPSPGSGGSNTMAGSGAWPQSFKGPSLARDSLQLMICSIKCSFNTDLPQMNSAAEMSTPEMP